MMETDYPSYVAAEHAAAAEPAEPELLPRQPKSVRETGLEQQLIVELTAKAMFITGKTHVSALTTRLRLPINVVREVLGFMVAEQLAEVAWRGESDVDIQYQLTGAGKQRAAVYLERCPYAGAAPVTLEAYRAMVRRQSWRQPNRPHIGADEVAAVFDGDNLDPGVLDLIGAAMHSGRSLFLYGPPGGGKSTLARKLGALLQGIVAVPYAVLVGQEIIRVHDPLLHLAPVPPYALQAHQLLERRGWDLRWTLCQRPVVQVGAELSDDMLSLRHDAFDGCYHAPPHFKANGGILIVDDLGRQRIATPDLLNRFMRPLDAGVDQLALRGGHKFSAPFDLVLVFATNLEPRALLDDSFLRRLGYKIHVGPLGEAGYRRLFLAQCRLQHIAFDEAVMRHLLDHLHGASGHALLASYPRELLGRIADFAGAAGRTPCLTVAAIEQAWASMFAACEAPPAAAGPGFDETLAERIW